MFTQSAHQLATLLTLADSRLPTGGHVHSGGIEEAITTGRVSDLGTLRAYLRRRIGTQGLVSASVAAAVHSGGLTVESADAETDARTPSPAARAASRAQGRGLLRLAKRVWPQFGAPNAGPSVWESVGARPHLPVVAGVVGRASDIAPEHTALSLVYTTMTGSATAAQRLLALDPADVAALTFELSALCEQTAAQAVKELADLSDPLLDVLAEHHAARERPLFSS
ncbi:urease accessory protein UreF [Mycolicibacterium bacteremicum]|uniref:Urease accessory protein UreF n=1 Tax=Mycolicibacterium bacteremicum TaxID=564198 RepID=A0A1W9YSR4_MYCBA|nr:urease accessory UreF family protein [Mycolicibacterium bacteremicum]MCV7433513.1 urease accessory protein UreF [Mycolicibacterium bacteremicum]ORA03073.1 urease accessory protein UreF [Mycolicibacterium bacteremicum]